jgi:hypothetical protein
MKSPWNALTWTIITGIFIIIGFTLMPKKAWKDRSVISTFGSNTLAFGCKQVTITNYISSDGTEKLAIRMEGKVVLTNLSHLVGQKFPVMIIHENHARALIWNTVQHGETSKAPGWHWTMLGHKAHVTVLLSVEEGYKASNLSCAYFWTDYDEKSASSNKTSDNLGRNEK